MADLVRIKNVFAMTRLAIVLARLASFPMFFGFMPPVLPLLRDHFLGTMRIHETQIVEIVGSVAGDDKLPEQPRPTRVRFPCFADLGSGLNVKPAALALS